MENQPIHVADGWSPIASHSIDVYLKPGEEKTFVFIFRVC